MFFALPALTVFLVDIFFFFKNQHWYMVPEREVPQVFPECLAFQWNILKF